jgi:hypothetical protein
MEIILAVGSALASLFTAPTVESHSDEQDERDLLNEDEAVMDTRPTAKPKPAKR